jgi:hypothetical protein
MSCSSHPETLSEEAIARLLKTKAAYLTCGDRWLVHQGCWQVFEKPYGKQQRKLLETNCLATALAVLDVEEIDGSEDAITFPPA